MLKKNKTKQTFRHRWRKQREKNTSGFGQGSILRKRKIILVESIILKLILINLLYFEDLIGHKLD